jgi:protein-tyrosine phosphatase
MDKAEAPPPPPFEWIEGMRNGKLTVSCAPPGGPQLYEHVRRWKDAGVSAVVSLLCPEEIGLLNLARETEVCAANGIELFSFPVPDHSVPHSMRATMTLALQLQYELARDKAVLIHCRAGIGRSVVLAACVMALQGVAPEEAFELIGQARGFPDVPEQEEQREWVLDFADRFT